MWTHDETDYTTWSSVGSAYTRRQPAIQAKASATVGTGVTMTSQRMQKIKIEMADVGYHSGTSHIRHRDGDG